MEEESGEPVLERARRATSEARRDREILRWIGRHRFVTTEVLAYRFGVTPRRLNPRIARFERAGLVTCDQPHPTEQRVVYLSAKGAAKLGLPRRRPPRPDAHRDHERAITLLTARLELDATAQPRTILTERDARIAEQRTGRRHSVDVRSARAGLERRWPDVILNTPDRLTAVEIELADKGRTRLRYIIAGYLASPVFDEVRFLVADPALRRRIQALAGELTAPAAQPLALFANQPAVTVGAWPPA